MDQITVVAEIGATLITMTNSMNLSLKFIILVQSSSQPRKCFRQLWINERKNCRISYSSINV